MILPHLFAKPLITIDQCITCRNFAFKVSFQVGGISSFLPPDYDEHGEGKAERPGLCAAECRRAPAPARHPWWPQDRVPSVSPG